MLKPDLIVDMALLGIVVWSAHLAGGCYVMARTDESYRGRGVARTGIAILASLAIVVRSAVTGG